MAKTQKLSPMMQQYTDIKENYKDCILFFRLGDFYEMFFDDAKTASQMCIRDRSTAFCLQTLITLQAT